MSQKLQRSSSSPPTISMRRADKATTTFMLQPTVDDSWVFFPQPSFSNLHDDDDDVDDDDEEDGAEERNRKMIQERESWMSSLWCKIFKAAKSPPSSVHGDYEKADR
jgi:hypothetical protein